MHIAIIDYGSGNLHSTFKAFEVVARELDSEANVALITDATALDDATHIVLPGVGAFGDCMAGLRAIDGMIGALKRNVLAGKKPFFGICVGMQLLATRGLEHGTHEGLGWIEGEVVALAPSDPNLKIPHMGWNTLELTQEHATLSGIAAGDHAYFVHSYHMQCADAADVLATCDYGGEVTALVAKENILGTQFHPEKSQKTGLQLIRNFLQHA